MFRRKYSSLLLARAVLRCGLLLLALHATLPMQLVLCLESGKTPRVEQAVNGHCLSSSFTQASECCAIDAEQLRIDHDTQHSLGISHEHCFGCEDLLIHASQDIVPADKPLLDNACNLGGYLYSIIQVADSRTGSSSPAGDVWQREGPPSLDLLRADCIQLLI